jgi:hypothetical protein
MRLKAPLRQYGLKEALKVDVFVLNRAAVLLGIVEGKPEREAILETAESTRLIRQVVDFLLLPKAGYEKLPRPGRCRLWAQIARSGQLRNFSNSEHYCVHRTFVGARFQ